MHGGKLLFIQAFPALWLCFSVWRRFFRRAARLHRGLLPGLRLKAEQGSLPAELLNLCGRQQRNHAIFPVKPGATLHPACAQAANSLGHTWACHALNLFRRHLAQNGKLWPKLFQHLFILLRHLFAACRKARGCSYYL